jgi:hypothetical protein
MTATQAQQLYVAYFNRPADVLGLAYWTGKPAAEASAAFASSAEYAATYAGMSTAARVDAIYQNLFGRSAEVSGLNYWGNLIDRGLISISNAVTQIAGGAQGTDLTAYNNKVTAASSFTSALDTSAEIVGYDGTAANNAAKVWLSGITTDATLVAATTQAALDAAVTAVVGGVVPQTDASLTIAYTTSKAAYDTAAATAATALAAATAADAAVTTAVAAKTAADAKAALTDAAALATASTTAASAASAAVTAKTAADADVVLKNAALATAISGGDTNAINLANAQKLIADAAAATAATSVTTTAAAAASAATASSGAAADDAAAAAAATTLASAITASTAASTAAKTAAGLAVTAANAVVPAAAATLTTADDAVAASVVVNANAALTSANASGSAAAEALDVIAYAAAEALDVIAYDDALTAFNIANTAAATALATAQTAATAATTAAAAVNSLETANASVTAAATAQTAAAAAKVAADAAVAAGVTLVALAAATDPTTDDTSSAASKTAADAVAVTANGLVATSATAVAAAALQPAIYTPQTFTLTTDIDSIVGTEGNDLVVAEVHDLNGNDTGVLEFGDAANGAGGQDTLRFDLRANFNVEMADYDFANFETVLFRSRNDMGGDVIVDFDGMTGVEEVQVLRFLNGDDVTLNNLGASSVVIEELGGNDVLLDFVDDIGAVSVTVSDANANNLDVELGSGITSIVFNLDGVNLTNDLSIESGDDLEAVTINVTGDTSIDEVLFEDGDDLPNLVSYTINASADLTADFDFAQDDGDDIEATLTINGAGDVELNLSNDDLIDIVYTGSGSLVIEGLEGQDGVRSFDASGATGDVTLDLDLDGNDLESFEYLGGSGVDTVEARNVFDAIANNDAVISLDGGEGDEDALWLYDADDLAEEAAGAYVNFEQLWIGDTNDNDFDLSAITGFSELHVSDENDSNDNISLTGLSASLARNIFLHDNDGSGDAFNDVTIELEDDTGLSDEVVLNLVQGDDTNNNDMIDELTINGVEKITINSTGETEDSNGNDTVNRIDDFDADRMAELVITGDVSLDINDNTDANQLELVDASAFTGAFLRMEDINVTDDFEFLGNEDAVTDYNIDVNADGDVFFTTFGGDDRINVSGSYTSSDIISINAGEGDNNISVDDNSDNASVFITVGDGDNDIDIDGAGDVTITAGDGDIDLYIDGDVDGDVSVTLGAGDSSIVIEANSNADSIQLTLGGGDDTVIIDNALDQNVVVEIADFDVGDDVLQVDDNANFTPSDYSLAIVGNAQNAIDVSDTVANIEVIEFAYEAVGGDYDFAEEYADGNLDGAMLFEALGLSADLVITTDLSEDGFIIAYNSGDAYLFAYDSNANGSGVDTVIEANEVSLVAILGSVEVGTLTADNFGF